MGCCCCCQRDRRELDGLESCGNISWPTVVGEAGHSTRTNRGETLCHKSAKYFTVPLCAHHRDVLKASISHDARNLEGPRFRGPRDQTCLPSDVCKVPKCGQPFHCRASICSDHFQVLAENLAASYELAPSSRQATQLQYPTRKRQPQDSIESAEGEVRSPGDERGDAESNYDNDLLTRTFDVPRLQRTAAPTTKPMNTDGGYGEDESAPPPPYDEAGRSAPSSQVQRRVKRSSSTGS